MTTSRIELSKRASAEQRKAANPAKSIWVGASAGTGKTKVLSDRVLRLLLSGVDGAKILCLTYTKAAAVQMNSRVAERLGKWAIMNETELEEELLKLFGNLPDNKSKLFATARRLFAILLDTPGGIKIQTIHSFCQEVLKRFPLEAGISPYFEIIDDRSVAEAIERIKSSLIANPCVDLSFLLDNFSEFKFPEIINAIINNRSRLGQIFDKYQSKEKLLDAQANILGIDPYEDVIAGFKNGLPTDDLKKLLQAWLASDGKNDRKNAQTLAECLEFFELEKYSKIFLTANDTIKKDVAVKAVATPEIIKIFTDEAERVLGTINKQKALRVFQSTKAIVFLADELLTSYELYKKTHAKMDYEDMILLTRKLLSNKSVANWVLYKLDGGIDNILIDEAQDTSPDQWEIIKSISEEFFAGSEKPRTIFAVGDRKQSIYSFQGADPDKFDEMQAYFAGKSREFEKVNLEVSFRSTTAVLDIVDKIFSIEAIKQGVAAKDENILHIPFRQGEEGKVEFWDILEPEEGENQEVWSPPIEHTRPPTTSTRMARKIAEHIKNSVQNGDILASKGRPIEYGDYLILVRRRNEFAEELIRECKSLGVAVSGIDRMKLLEQIAIQDLIGLGKFLLLPDDDLSLAETLKSPIFNLDDDDLLELCPNRKGSLWHALKSHPKYSSTAEKLSILLNMSDLIRPFELYSHVLNDFGGRQNFYQRMGEEAEDGLDEFMNLALNFEQTNIPSLQKFINWISADNVEIKRELEQGQANLVRLMTVHGSKGLQAPIIILPDTTGVPKCDKKAELLIDNDLFFYPPSGSDYEDVCSHLKDKERIKMLEEYRRLLYVALTRAEDKMILCGFQKAKKLKDESWYNLIKTGIGDFAVYDETNKAHIYTSPQTITADNKKTTESPNIVFESADWIKSPAPAETPLAKPLSPSKPDDEPAVLSPLLKSDSDRFYKRGSIIHKLLQYLPGKDISLTGSFIKNQAPELPESEVLYIKDEVVALIKTYPNLFDANSKAEVSIMGVVNGKIISGKIDRLIVEDNKVTIIDFKTNRPAAADLASVPEVYKKQMAAYKELLTEIYPNKTIITLILWTNNITLMEV